MNLKIREVVDAIAVLSVMAEKEFDATKSDQSPKWIDLRSAIYHLVSVIEELSVDERNLIDSAFAFDPSVQ